MSLEQMEEHVSEYWFKLSNKISRYEFLNATESYLEELKDDITEPHLRTIMISQNYFKTQNLEFLKNIIPTQNQSENSRQPLHHLYPTF